jgi:hypothetical protein
MASVGPDPPTSPSARAHRLQRPATYCHTELPDQVSAVDRRPGMMFADAWWRSMAAACDGAMPTVVDTEEWPMYPSSDP